LILSIAIDEQVIVAWHSVLVFEMLKRKLSHYTPRRRLGGRKYSSCSFSTLALDGGEWSASRLARALAQGKGPPVPTVQEARWAPEPVWTQRLEEQSFRLCRGSNLDRPVVQLVARHYTDWATRITYLRCTTLEFWADYNLLTCSWFYSVFLKC
jgi:hypothetical protein